MRISAVKFGQMIVIAMGVAVFWIAAPWVSAQDSFKLKPGAKGALCLTCHEQFKKVLEKPNLHPLLKNGDCSGCHAPHTSGHDMLLTSDITRLCSNCHRAVLPEKPKSSHRIVYDGRCKNCHDPHGSDNTFILVRPGNQLCLECHKEISDIVANAAFKHAPLRKEKGCLNCHLPHASTERPFLLKGSPPALCKTCHQTDTPAFTRKHTGYPVADSNCLSCHDPHGSDRKGILYANAHTPVRDNKCTECHPEPSSSAPLKTKKQGVELCRQCHQETIDQALSKNRLHWPLVDNKGCLNCHAPHGAKRKKLLSGPTLDVCGKCHADTVELQAWSKNNPKNKNLCAPVKSGDCIGCHAPHSADSVLLFTRSPVNSGLCGKCHEWQTHSTHPIGEKVVDQRNRNLTMDCLSCHRACGTGNKPSMLHYELTEELCIQCHTDRKR